MYVCMCVYVGVYKYNTGLFFVFLGGGGLRLPYVYVGGAHEKKVGNHCTIPFKSM